MLPRRTVLQGMAGAAVLPLAAAIGGGPARAATRDLVAPDTLDTDAGELTIQPINHATLSLSLRGQMLLFDPVGGPGRYEGLPEPAAIFVTHAHADHFDVPTLEGLAGPQTPLIVPEVVFEGLPDRLRGQARAMTNGDTGTVASFAVDVVPMSNITPDRLKYHSKGVGNGYVLAVGGRKVHVAGDTEPVPELMALTGITVSFLPMNLPYTETGEQAAQLAKAMKPTIVYPYHYGKDGPEPARFAAAMQGTSGIEVRQRDWYAYG